MAGKVFAGNVRLTPVNALGVAIAGAIGLVNTVKCELVVPAPNNIDQISRQIGTVGQIKSRAQEPKPTTLNVSIDDLDDQRVLAYALNGVAVTYAQAATTVAVQVGGAIVDEPVVASTPLGTPVALANRQVSVVVVKNTAGTTTYVVGTDYTVDAAAGTITALLTGTITAGQSLKVSYTAAALTAQSVTAPARLGDAFPLGYRHVSNFVLKNSAGTITYAAGTDYLLDAKPGFVTIPAGSTIVLNASLKATYTAAAIAGQTVQGSTVPSTLLRIDVQLESMVDGSEAYFVCPIYQASSSGNQDLFGKNMLVAALQGAMFLPPAGTAANAETGGAPYILTSIAA